MEKKTSANRQLALTKIWQLYQKAAATTASIRTGYVIDHVRDEMAPWFFRRRPESVAEHSYKFAVLWGAAMLYFPEIYSKSYTTNMFMKLFFSLLHDFPEGDPRGPGDVPDNGCPEHDDAKGFERQSMSEMLGLLPEATAKTLLCDYDAFESYAALDDGDLVMQACKLFDKLEAVFSLLYDENCGIRGYIDSAPGYPNEIDFERADYLGVRNTTDVWAFGLRKLMKQKKVNGELETLVMDLLKTAFTDVRKKIPYCLTADLDLCT